MSEEIRLCIIRYSVHRCWATYSQIIVRDDLELANDDLYRTTSGFLDACVGVSGKGSPDARNFQRLRNRIRMPGDQSGEAGLVEPVKPVPEPMK